MESVDPWTFMTTPTRSGSRDSEIIWRSRSAIFASSELLQLLNSFFNAIRALDICAAIPVSIWDTPPAKTS